MISNQLISLIIIEIFGFRHGSFSLLAEFCRLVDLSIDAHKGRAAYGSGLYLGPNGTNLPKAYVSMIVVGFPWIGN